MHRLSEEEERLVIQAVHRAFVNADGKGDDEKAENLRTARDKLES